MPVTSKEEIEDRIADTEEHLVRLRSARRVEAALSKKYGVTRRTVRRWLKTVRERWAKEAEAEAPELIAERRVNYRATLNEVLTTALHRTKPMRDGGKIVHVADPDLRSALSAIEQLRRLDGIDSPEAPRLFEGKLSGNLGLTDFFAMIEEEKKA